MIEKKVIEIEKIVAITEEVDASFQFISSGLKNLKEQTSIVSNNHVTIQLLSSGFERILKIMLLIKDKHLDGKFPELQIAKKRFSNYNNGHGIEKMLDELIEYSYEVELMQRIPMVVEDVEFIKSNSNFREFLNIITEFSIQQRYFYIDTIILENRNQNKNPFSHFKEFILSFDEGVDKEKQSYSEEDAIRIKNAIICIEKGAISRFFTHGFDGLGQQYYDDFSNFIFLNDEDLGKLNYAEKKTRLSDTYKPLSSNSLQFIKILSISKSKIINSSEYTDWPFTVHSVKVFSLNGNFFFAKIGNEIFALTGKTSTHYKIPSYFASNKLKPRQNALYLLDNAKLL
jgi:hypothetical protein